MRVIPGMKVLCPCDGHEMKLAVEALLNYDGPAYLRLGRAAVDTVTDEIPGYRFELDKGIELAAGSDVTVIATGMMVQMALAARETMAKEGVSVRVIDMHTIKPLDGALVEKAAKETGCIVTSEEHNIIGGLGGAVAEYVGEHCPVPVVRHGVNDEFGRSGKAGFVCAPSRFQRRKSVNTPAAIAARAKSVQPVRYARKSPASFASKLCRLTETLRRAGAASRTGCRAGRSVPFVVSVTRKSSARQISSSSGSCGCSSGSPITCR